MVAEIKVGDGATRHLGSDSQAWTVIQIVNSKTVWVQRDLAVMASRSLLSENQQWALSRNTEGMKVKITLRKDGFWRIAGLRNTLAHFTIGERSEYRDPSR